MIRVVRNREHLPLWNMVAAFSLLLIVAAVHLKISSLGVEKEKERQPRLGPRIPVHPPDPGITSSHPLYREMESILERISSLETEEDVPSSWRKQLDKMALQLLYELETVALDMGEDVRVRCIILEVLSQFKEEAMRQFYARLFADPREDYLVREKALYLLEPYLDPPGFRDRTRTVLSSTLEVEPDSGFREQIQEVLSGEGK